MFDDNEAVIKMMMKGRSPTMRHVCRAHRVALDWCFDRIDLDPKIQIKYIDTKKQLADILTKGNFTRDEWNHLLCLFNISHFSSTMCSGTMAKRSQQDSGGERVTAKSRPMMNLIARTSSLVSSSSSVSPVKRSYGNQDPWSTIAEKDERSRRPDIGKDWMKASDYYYHEHQHELLNVLCPVFLVCQRIVIHCTCTAWLKSWVLCSLVIPSTRSWSGRLHLKLVDNLLRTPPKESMDSFEETYLHTGYEPNSYDFKETSVEPYTELPNSPPCVKLTEYITIALDDKTCLTVCRRRPCPTERDDLLETERDDLLRKLARRHRLGLCSTNKKRANSCRVPGRNHQTRISSRLRQKKFAKIGWNCCISTRKLHCARAEEVQQRDHYLLQGQLSQQNLELREAHQKSVKWKS